MLRSVAARIWLRAADEPVFRRSVLRDLGSALAEEGFVLTDEEMREVRDFWETLRGLADREAHARIAARARSQR